MNEHLEINVWVKLSIDIQGSVHKKTCFLCFVHSFIHWFYINGKRSVITVISVILLVHLQKKSSQFSK